MRLKAVFGFTGKPPARLPGHMQTWPLFGPDSSVVATQSTALQLYSTSGYLRAISDKIADNVAGARWRVFKSAKKGERDFGLSGAGWAVREKAITPLRKTRELVESPSHRALAILENPNEDFTGWQTLALLQIHLDLAGECFLLLTRDEGGAVNGFVPLPPSCVSATPAPGYPYFLVSYETLRGPVPASEILWFKHPNPAAPLRRGTGLAMALADELDASESIGTAVKAAMGRGGLPVAVAGVAEGNGAPGDALDDLKEQWDEQFGNPARAGKILFANGKVTFAAFQANFRELQTSELGMELLKYVRQCYGVSAEILGDLSSGDRQKADAARFVFADQVVAPRLEFLRCCLQKWFVPLVDASAILHYDDIRPQDFARLKDMMTLQPGAFYLNEFRVAGGLEPDPSLDGMRPLPMPGQTAPVQSQADGQPMPVDPAQEYQ